MHDLPDELRKGAGFGSCCSPGRKNRPKIDPRQLPIPQDDLHGAIGNFGREHPFRDDRKTGVRKDGGAQTLSGGDAARRLMLVDSPAMRFSASRSASSSAY